MVALRGEACGHNNSKIKLTNPSLKAVLKLRAFFFLFRDAKLYSTSLSECRRGGSAEIAGSKKLRAFPDDDREQMGV